MFARFARILAHSSIQVFSRSFRFWGCRGATRSFSSLHRFSIGFRSGDWLVRSISRSCCVFGVIVMLEDPATTLFNALTEGRRLLAKILRYMAPSILPSIRCSRPVPFAEKHPKALCFHPHASRSGWCWDCTHLSSSSKHSEWSFYQKVIFLFHLTTCLLWIIQMVFGKLQTGLDMCWLEQGDLARAAGF